MSISLKPITLIDILGLIGLLIFVLGVLFIAEILKRKEIVGGATTRKIVHLSVGNVVLVFPYIFSSLWVALLGPIFFIFFTYLTCPASPIKKFRLKSVADGHTYGTVFYAISFTILTAIFFRTDPSDQHNIILVGSFMPLVWGDGISAVIGSKYGDSNRYTIFGGSKSLLGSWAAAFATFGAVTVSSLIFQQTLAVSVYIGMLTGLVTAVVEAITPKGFDNLAVPISNALILFGIYRIFEGDLANLNNFLSLGAIITGVIVGLTLAIVGKMLKALTWDGAIAGFYFGVIILGLGSWSWGAMYVSFFILGSLFTFVGKQKKQAITEEFEKGDTARDSVQAMVNSIIPAILALLYVLVRHPILAIASAGALATSLGDTIGTEIGSLSVNKPRLALKPWIKVERGTPGGISVIGTLATILAAVIIGTIGWSIAFIDNLAILPEPKWSIILFATIGGVVGSYIDSMFACTIQKLNKCTVCGKITEKRVHCEEKTQHHSGLKWMKNDLVNLFSIGGGSLCAVAIYLLFSVAGR